MEKKESVNTFINDMSKTKNTGMRDRKSTQVSLYTPRTEIDKKTGLISTSYDNSSMISKKDIENLSEDIDHYNNNIHILDSRYSSLKLNNSKVIVRVLAEPIYEETSHGILMKNTSMVKQGTKAGHGHLEIENPYTYTRNAIVVNSSTTSFKAGDRVILDVSAIYVKGLGDGLGFFNPFWINLDDLSLDGNSPTSVNDPNYGYLLIDPYLITATYV